MKKKITILQVLPSLISGGVERGTVDIAKAIAKEGYVSLVASSGGVMAQQLPLFGVKHIKMPLNSKNPITIFLNIRRLVKLIKENNIDIIHARSRAPAWSAYFACKKTGCKFITTWHGTYSGTTKLKKTYNSIMGRGEKVIAVSNFIKNHILSNYKIAEDKIEVIHRGVEVDKFCVSKVNHERLAQVAAKLCMEHDRPVILLPARFTEWKGHLFLLEALSKIKDLSFMCFFVGKASDHGGYSLKVKEKIKQLDLEKRVFITDNVTDMPALYCLADIVVSASLREEAFGRVAVEACAMEKLTIATNIGGSQETIIDGVTGVLVEPNNIDQMAQTLRKMLNMDSKEAKKITQKARENVVRNFSLSTMQQLTLDVYSNVLS